MKILWIWLFFTILINVPAVLLARRNKHGLGNFMDLCLILSGPLAMFILLVMTGIAYCIESTKG